MGVMTSTGWVIPVFGLSPNVWNVLKFLILEIVISVFIRTTYIQLLRTRTQNEMVEGRYISLVTTNYGRLTPYDFMWWSSAESDPDAARHRAPKALLFLLNVCLLALAITAEFGSGSAFMKRRGTLVGFGKQSESLARGRTIPTPKYVTLKSFVPDPSCIKDGQNGGRLVRGLDKEGHCSSKVTSKETTSVFGCASHPGEIMKKICDVETVKHVIGAKGARGSGYDDVLLVLNITRVRRISPAEVTGLFDNTTGQRVIADGVFIKALSISAGHKIRIITSLRRKASCYLKFNEAFKHNATRKKWMYLARACHVSDEDFEAVFVSHRRFKGAYGEILQQESKGFQSSDYRSAPVALGDTVVVSPKKGTVVIRQGLKDRKPVHPGIILYVSETRRVRTFIDQLSSFVRLSLHARLSDDIVARLLGFIQGIGEYKYDIVTEGAEPVASVNLFFLVPLAIMFIVSALQGFLSLRRRPGPAIPCTFEEAVSKYGTEDTGEILRTKNDIPTFRAVMLHEHDRKRCSVDGLISAFMNDDIVRMNTR